MKVQDLINQLEKLNPNADVTFIVNEYDAVFGVEYDRPLIFKNMNQDDDNEVKFILTED